MAKGSDIELRCGDWSVALADVGEVDVLISDPPYSERTHSGHDDGASLANRAGRPMKRSDGGTDIARPRRALSYQAWGAEEVQSFVRAWAPRVRGWLVCLSDSDLCMTYRAAYEANGLTGFHPLPCVIPGMTVRMSGDGPSSWAIYANVARPKHLYRWGTLPGAYIVRPGERVHIGGKPLTLMRALVRDYSRPGDLICDPCAGGATTLIAAATEGRRAIGAELDPKTHALALKRIAKGYTPSLFAGVDRAAANDNAEPEQASMLDIARQNARAMQAGEGPLIGYAGGGGGSKPKGAK